MKKIVLFAMVCLMVLPLYAQQHFAVFRFKAVNGITQEQADTISANFIAHFHPEGYAFVDPAKVDQAIADQGYFIPRMTRGQVVRIGQLLDAQKISQGLVEVVAGKVTVEGRVMDVARGTIIVLESVTFPYGSSSIMPMRKLAARMASSLDSVMRSQAEENYVDLGLPSGTLWKDKNEIGFYDYDAAVKTFGCCIPTKDQLDELRSKCRWVWNGMGYKVIGPNGKSIVMPAAGYLSCGGSLYDIGASGLYWSSDPNGSDIAWCLHFLSSFVHMNYDSSCGGVSVRLVLDNSN